MTTFASDDLAQIVIAPDREFVGYAQGILREWDPATHRNTVEVRGGVLTDLPISDRIGALTYTPGQVLKLIRWKQRRAGGIAVYWIDGSVEFPAEGRAEDGVAFLRGQLAKQIAHEIFGEQVHAAENPASGGTSSITYTATLAGGDGPILTDVEVSEVGLAIVGVQAQISIIADFALTRQAYMSYRVTGATTRDAFDVNAKRTDIGDTDDAHITNVTDQSMSWSLQSGLNPGLHTFETMYRANYAAAFAQRRIIVIAL